MPRRVDPKTGRVYEYKRGQWVPVNRAVEETGAMGAAVIGAGSTLRELGQGALQFGGWLGGRTAENSPAMAELRDQVAAEQDLLAPLREEYPVASFLGGMVPELATGAIGATRAAGARLARPLLGSRAGSTMAEQAALGAGIGALGYEETLSGRVFNSAVSAVGGAAGFQVGRMADRVRRQIGAYANRGRALEGDLTGTVRARGDVEGAITAGPRESAAARGAAGRGLRADVEAGLGDPRLEQPLPTRTRDVRVREAEALGFELTPGMRSGDGPIARWEAGFESFPPTSGLMAGVKSRNYARLSSFIGRSLDMPGTTDMGLENLGRANDIIGAKFDNVARAIDGQGGIPAEQVRKAATDSIAELQGFGRDLPGRRVVNEIVAQLDGAEGNMPASTVREWRSYLSKRFRDFNRQDGAESSAEVVRNLMEKIDSAIEARAPKKLKGTMKKAREQWRMLIALRQGAAVQPDGTINVRTFARNLRNIFRPQWEGRQLDSLSKPMRDAIKATQVASTITPAFPDSGTASRMSVQGALDAPARTAAMTAGASLVGDTYAKLAGRMSPQALGAAALGPAGTAAPAAAGAVGRALSSQLNR